MVLEEGGKGGFDVRWGGFRGTFFGGGCVVGLFGGIV